MPFKATRGALPKGSINETNVQYQDEDLDPFAMPIWRKVLWSIVFFIMVATANIGNMIGEIGKS